MPVLSNREAEVARALHPSVVEYISLCADTVSLIEDSIQRALSKWNEVDSLAARVNIALLVRLCQDLRSASMLAAIGYSTQALAIIASSFEIAFTVAYIGNHEERAEEWNDHDDPTKQFRKVRILVNTVMEEHGAPEENAKGHYRIYRQLCLGKHGNPLFTKRHPFEERDEGTIISLEPRFEESTVRVVQFTLECAAGLGTLAVRVFMSCFGGGEAADLAGRLRGLEERYKALQDEAVARWGTDDPFPGKW